MPAPARNTNLGNGAQAIPPRGSQSFRWLATRARLGRFGECVVTIPFNVLHLAGSIRSPGRNAAAEHCDGSYRFGKKLAMLLCAENTWPRNCQRKPKSRVSVLVAFQVSWTYNA